VPGDGSLAFMMFPHSRLLIVVAPQLVLSNISATNNRFPIKGDNLPSEEN
jgi:hypothetical protein